MPEYMNSVPAICWAIFRSSSFIKSRPKFREMIRPSVNSKQVKQNVARKKMVTRRLMVGCSIVWRHCAKRARGGTCSADGVQLSERMKKARHRSTAHRALATQPGPLFPNQPALRLPIHGPKIKPRPKAMPMSPIRFDR